MILVKNQHFVPGDELCQGESQITVWADCMLRLERRKVDWIGLSNFPKCPNLFMVSGQAGCDFCLDLGGAGIFEPRGAHRLGNPGQNLP